MSGMHASQSESGVMVSFVIPCYNGRQYLDQCLESIQALCLPHYEAIVVDDGSTEDIQSVVERYVPMARYVRQANQGPAAARNLGIQEASGTYIHFLDSDDYLISPTGTRMQLAVLEKNPAVGLVYAQSAKVDQAGNRIGVRKQVSAEPRTIQSGLDELSRLFFDNYITTSSVIVRRSTIQQIGGFDQRYFGPEDWDCWLRMAQVSSFAYIAEPVVAYRLHEKSITAGYSVEPWLRMHMDILDRAFSNPDVAQRYGAMRTTIDARMHYWAATLSYMNGQPQSARRHAKMALRMAGHHRSLQNDLKCVGLIAKSFTPRAARPVLRTASRRYRRMLAAVR